MSQTKISKEAKAIVSNCIRAMFTDSERLDAPYVPIVVENYGKAIMENHPGILEVFLMNHSNSGDLDLKIHLVGKTKTKYIQLTHKKLNENRGRTL